MRFNLNQKYVFFAFQFKFEGRKDPIEKAHAYPTTDLSVDIVDVKFIEAVCKEHHKVASEYDDKEQDKKYDGFIFEHEGMQAYNQYPRASYGQMGDSADRKISFFYAMFEKFGGDCDALTNSDQYLEYSLFTTHMEHLERALWSLNPENGGTDLGLYEKLQARKELLVKALAEQLNKEIKLSPYFARFKDGRKEHVNGFYTVELVDLSK